MYYETQKNEVYVYDPNGRSAILDGNLSFNVDVEMRVDIPTCDETIITNLKNQLGDLRGKKRRKLMSLKEVFVEDANEEPQTSHVQTATADEEPLPPKRVQITKTIQDYEDFLQKVEEDVDKTIQNACKRGLRESMKDLSNELKTKYKPNFDVHFFNVEQTRTGKSTKQMNGNLMTKSLKEALGLKNDMVTHHETYLKFKLQVVLKPDKTMHRDEFAIAMYAALTDEEKSVTKKFITESRATNAKFHSPCAVPIARDPLAISLSHYFKGRKIIFQPVPSLNVTIQKNNDKVIQFITKMFPKISQELFITPGICATLALHYLCEFIKNKGNSVDTREMLDETNFLFLPRGDSDVFVLTVLMNKFYEYMDNASEFKTLLQKGRNICENDFDKFSEILESANSKEDALLPATIVQLLGNAAGYQSAINKQGVLVFDVRSSYETFQTDVQELFDSFIEKQKMVTLKLTEDNKLVNNEGVTYVNNLRLDNRRNSIAYKTKEISTCV